jgi:hypothetical protein
MHPPLPLPTALPGAWRSATDAGDAICRSRIQSCIILGPKRNAGLTEYINQKAEEARSRVRAMMENTDRRLATGRGFARLRQSRSLSNRRRSLRNKL